MDASALVDALTGADGSEALRHRLASEQLHAPGLVDYEVVSALRGLTLGGHLSAHRAEDVLTDLDDLPLQRWPAADLLRRRAFQLRRNLSAYDAAYLSLAEILGCPLVTRDRRLARSRAHRARLEVI
ncbi:MAG TPA: type II toxin-antitoxin system VapC family toxin [Jatrophihabitans sp.]